jgi:predicted hydrocarbon binding protein
MKTFREFLTEAKINIKTDKDLVKALYDIESNATGKGKTLAMKAAEYIEDNELDQKAAKMITNMSSELGSRFSQIKIINAVEDYVELNV